MELPCAKTDGHGPWQIVGMQTMSILTDKQAYAAMFRYLEDLYARTRSDEIGGLLGAMSMVPDGLPADPAIADDWRAAVEYVLNGGEAGRLELKK